jgi:hypothetical protein
VQDYMSRLNSRDSSQYCFSVGQTFLTCFSKGESGEERLVGSFEDK